MLASHPSWETYAHLVDTAMAQEPTTAHPSQLVCPFPLGTTSLSSPTVPPIAVPAPHATTQEPAIPKRKRNPSTWGAPTTPSSPEQDPRPKAKVPKKEAKAVRTPSVDGAPASRASSSITQTSTPTSQQSSEFGSNSWSAPEWTPSRPVDWTAVSHLPPNVIQVLQTLCSPNKGQYQPHLDSLRSSVLEGHRPDLVTLYTAKLHPRKREDDGTRLSSDAKRANHLASEQKRRTNIRKGYQELASRVPELQHLNREEIKVGMAMESLYLRKGTSLWFLMLGWHGLSPPIGGGKVGR